MSSYSFVSNSKGLKLESNKYRVIVSPKNEHLYISVEGPYFKKKELSNIKAEVNGFEMKAIALYFAKKARDWLPGHTFRIKHVNYAEIFGSCFD